MKWNLAELLPGECIPGIVHDTVKVIDFSQRVHLPRLHLQKVILLSCERKRRKAQLQYEADSQCATLSMHVKGEDLLCLKYLSYTEAITPRNICRLRRSIYCTINSKLLVFFLVLPSQPTSCAYKHLTSSWSLTGPLLRGLCPSCPYCPSYWHLPGWILSLIMLTCSSRSGRVCSCQNPITWPNSCTTMPNLSQFFPIDMAWGPPPRRPT